MQYDINNPKYQYSEQPPRYNPYGSAGTLSLDKKVSAVMKQVYLQMSLALVVTAIVSIFCANSGFIVYYATHSWLMWVLLIAELGIVLGVTGAIHKLSSGVAAGLFFLFAVINGMLLSPIFIIYTKTSIATTFFITAGTFGAMSAYGYFTNRDLSKMGTILFMALIGLIIATIVNIFLKSSTMGWIISFAGVLIFTGLTAWDTQKVKQMAIAVPNDSIGKLAVIGALNLYLDFINLFLYLLRFFGRSNN